ncbi:MAG: hypothetical protein D6755_03685, partial [Anaerolineae bacterium]
LLLIGGPFAWAIYSDKRRKRQYLPPTIKIAGNGIKRGLTAIEAAVLLEQPVDRILTMMLFSVVQKGAARVLTRDPLKIEVLDTEGKELRAYEKQFLEAMSKPRKREKRKDLQDVLVSLVRSVNKKVKGFSYRQTRAYYQSIIKKAWQQVEQADTPEVQMKALEEALPWTLLDEDFDDRAEKIFRTRPVYLPHWWSAYDPGTQGAARPRQTGHPTGGAVSASPRGGAHPSGLPTLPGGEFAASVVSGIQNFSSQIIGNLTDFTSGITQKTNPIPKSSSSSHHGGGSSGGHSCACACACACAGCACACAGGGR